VLKVYLILLVLWKNGSGFGACIAVFPILADVGEVKTGSRSTAHWSNDVIRLNGCLRNCFAQLITPLDIDGIGQNWEDSNTSIDPKLRRRIRGWRSGPQKKKRSTKRTHPTR